MIGLGIEGDWSFLFQGKEYIDFEDYNVYDFHSRNYDPWTGRFWQIDGADQFASGYIGMGNMPTMGVDPDGQLFFVIPQIGWSKSGDLSVGLELGIGVPWGLSASITGGYNFGSKKGYGSIQASAGGFYGGYGTQGGFAGWGYRYAGLNAGISYGREGFGVGVGYGSSYNNYNGALGIGWSQGGGMDFGITSSYTQFLGSSIREMDFIKPTIDSDPIQANDINLNSFAKEYFGEYKTNLSISELTTENFSNLPNGFSFRNDFIYNNKNEQIGGIVVRNGNKSRVFISPGVFAYGKYALFTTTGHEFVHSFHNSKKLYNLKLSEAAAYNWSYNVAFSYGDNRASYFLNLSQSYLRSSGYKVIPGGYKILPKWFPVKF